MWLVYIPGHVQSPLRGVVDDKKNSKYHHKMSLNNRPDYPLEH